MKRIYYILFSFVIFVLCVLYSCKKDELKIYKLELKTETVVKDRQSAEITVEYTYPVRLERVVGLISVSGDMVDVTNAQAVINDKVFVVKFQELQANTTYYYQYEYSNGVDFIKTEIKNFTTDDYGLPVVITDDVSNITVSSASCGGNVTDAGGLEITARGVCWSTNANPTVNDEHTTDGTGIGEFLSSITNLSIGTKYYVRAYATTNAGTSYGNQKEFTTENGLPTVYTSGATNITTTTATCSGDVTNDGGFEITAKGFCWSTSPNPTVNDSHTVDGTGTGSFTSNLTDLNSYTKYYARAYATNSVGTSYGGQIELKTLIVEQEGIVNGLFSVSATNKIVFSKGNLQYRASSNTWRFAENQYDYIGDANSNISSTYSGWIDLFGWGTSGYNHGAVCYQPYSTSYTVSDYYAYGNASYNLYDQTGKADWGYNAISNGGNTTNNWRTLTSDEWVYVFNTRNTISGIRYAKAQINGVNGVILLPDDWNTSTYSLNSTNTSSASYTTNAITAANWSILENAGAVFLPAAGYRGGTNVYYVGSDGGYWSASYGGSDYARDVWFSDGGLFPDSRGDRSGGFSVRLVCSAQ